VWSPWQCGLPGSVVSLAVVLSVAVPGAALCALREQDRLNRLSGFITFPYPVLLNVCIGQCVPLGELQYDLQGDPHVNKPLVTCSMTIALWPLLNVCIGQCVSMGELQYDLQGDPHVNKPLVTCSMTIALWPLYSLCGLGEVCAVQQHQQKQQHLFLIASIVLLSSI
jgi:hypothetical protein